MRTLRQRVGSILFERTALSRKPDELIQQELATLRESNMLSPALLLKDPYILDFLGLQDRYLEKDPEDAILKELENFLLEQKMHEAVALSKARLENRARYEMVDCFPTGFRSAFPICPVWKCRYVLVCATWKT